MATATDDAGDPAAGPDWLRSCHERGRGSVRLLRADPSLLPELRLGTWWEAGPRDRALREVPWRPVGRALAARVGRELGGDLAFWAGVRAEATRAEWRRLARSSYAVLCYHRVAGEGKPGQERMDLSPARFRRQLATLRLLGWRPLPPAQLVAFHTDPRVGIGRRRYVLTLDDAFLDAVAAARRAARHRPQVFAVTAATGGSADWLGGEPVAGWGDLAGLVAAGGVVGSHARRHVRLDTLTDEAIDEEVAGSLADLRRHVAVEVPLIAYPHGAHDVRVRDAARRAGYAAGYSSLHGRNGPGTDLFALRRVEPKESDNLAVFLWKVLTGANRPPAYRRLLRLARRRTGTSAARSRSPR